ncbi:MAG: hypothetical protein KDH19_08155, partial [Geminicoccaceae bacterium]|nr:hypothetical protein [Geminicoccaceae bacterium]
RCLPLNIANACGWEIGCASAFEAGWDGGAGKEAIRIDSDAGAHELPVSHFGSGVLTFHVNALFRTEPGVNLWAGGPVNRPKDAIQPLAGIVETDWAPYTFTMNWKFTRAGQRIRFEKGEPFCFLFPLLVDLVEASEPEVRDIASEPELDELYKSWSASRSNFNKELGVEGSKARSDKWQKTYFRGNNPDGSAPEIKHRTKVRVPPFR